MTIWMQSRSGAAINLMEPDPKAVDFREIAEALGGINRFFGHTSRPVSVALHTLTVAEITARANPAAMPWALLHDAHEAYLGDITTPVQTAIAIAAGETQGVMTHQVEITLAVSAGIAALKARHDKAILTASGLLWRSPTYPDEGMAAVVKNADRIAMMTERRDFLGHPKQPWSRELEAIKPLRKPIK